MTLAFQMLTSLYAPDLRRVCTMKKKQTFRIILLARRFGCSFHQEAKNEVEFNGTFPASYHSATLFSVIGATCVYIAYYNGS